MRALVYHGPQAATGLVDTFSTPTLLKLTSARQVDAHRFVTHHFVLDQFMEVYHVSAHCRGHGCAQGRHHEELTWRPSRCTPMSGARSRTLG
jgi:hypothetical protein